MSTVQRRQLLERLAPGDGNSVVTVLAPLGYGKTTLVHQHVVNQRRPKVWVTLNQHDHDPALPIGRLVDALRPIIGSDRRLDRAVDAPGISVWDRLVPRLASAMADLPRSTIVFDDLHEVEAAGTLDVLGWLMLHVPEGSQMLFVGRSGDRLPLARLRVGAGLLELDGRDLAFSDEEAHAMLTAAGWAITAKQAAELNARCEGWPAGIRLATMSDPVDGHVEDATAIVPGGRALDDYVRQEFLGRLPPVRARFILRSSVLYRLTGKLCDHALDIQGSGAMLESISRSNAFLMPLDDRGDWYRCHDLVREVLVAELERTDPGTAARVRARASDWHAAVRRPVEAVHYQQEVDDDEATVRRMGAMAQELFGGGGGPTYVEWFDWAEARDLTRVHPSLPLSGALSFAITGEPDRAVRYAAALESMEWEGPMTDGTPSVEGWKALARAFACARGTEEAVRDARTACDLIPDSSSWHRPSCLAHGLALLLDGQPEAGRDVLTRAGTGEIPAGPAPNARAVGHALLAKLALDGGDLDGAERSIAVAEQIRGFGALQGQGPQAMQDAVVARLAIARGDQDEAHRRLVSGQRVRGQLTWAMPGVAALARLELARVHLLLADAPGARTLILEVQDILHRRSDLGIVAKESDLLRERLAGIRGDVVGASTLTAAELRLVPMLATHLTFGEIGNRLLLSPNTIKTQALSVYRKLDATSRGEAVRNAVRVGLIDPAAVTAVILADK